MKVTVIRGSELTEEQYAAWARLQRENRALDSPFFHPAFTQAVAAVRSDVEVAVIEDGRELVGFFPFQRKKNNVAEAVGGCMSDFQGVVLASGTTIDPLWLIRQCGLSAWRFDYLIGAQATNQPFGWAFQQSPYIDASGGFEAFQAARREAGGQTLQKMARKLRKLEREVGPARFEMATTDEEVFNTLGRWKSEHYRSLKVVDRFSFGWIRELMLLLIKQRNAEFGGMLSAWYVNDQLVAVHYGIHANHVLHSWVPSYDKEYYRHSPGSQCLIEIIKAARGLGIERIDLGVGDEEYKTSFGSGATPVAVGCIDSRPAAAAAQRLWFRTKHWVKSSRYRRLAERPWFAIRRMRDRLQFR